ncbi:type I methionyl aminopeptidase [Lignipirellula cremea]|uniref:Methionine aminopeptidase n=1 Tax=Lignipirellula cremea TaxID=2528010 RepID=A0A518E3P9_9BACT|nr:type I methionyl aminopeptidase [Lignipirellula cremea]QDU98720.1 Methionine aminopeptidase [Lignipirellula cremea]
MHFGTQKLKLKEPQRDRMRAACSFNAQVLDMVRSRLQPGVTTEEIDNWVHTYTLDHGHTPACLGYLGFPKSCCTSVNDVICHGIPGPYRLQEGDIVNIDLTSIVDGWHGDQSETFLIGEVSDEARQVTQCSFDALYAAIDALQPNCRISEIGKAIVAVARQFKFSVVQEYVGHGLGRQFHQEPSIPHYPTPESRLQRLAPGICFTIEPMINVGGRNTTLDRGDGWTVRTKDGTLSAQFEHTILMTEDGPEILTLTADGPQKGHQF